MTDWSRYVAYQCRHPLCQEHCINLVESPAAQTKQCWQCYRERDSSDLRSLDGSHLPDESTTADVSPVTFE